MIARHGMNDETGQYSGMRRRASLALLVLVNALPVAGVLFLDWDVLALMVLYWSENLVLGFYTLASMLVKSPLGGLGMALFFCIHYGGFCAAHGLVILTVLTDADPDLIQGDRWPLFLVFVQLLVGVIRAVLEFAPVAWLLAFAALFVSHGVSFIVNFLLGGERDRLSLQQLMTSPYKRIMILHVAVIAGGIAVTALGQPIGMLLVLVALKLSLDIALHLKEHRAAERGEARA